MPRKKRPPPPPLTIRALAPKPEALLESASFDTDPTIQAYSSPEEDSKYGEGSVRPYHQSRRSTLTTGAEGAAPCGIPQCARHVCKLQTHKEFARRLRDRRRASAVSATSRRSSRAGIDDSAPSTRRHSVAQYLDLPLENGNDPRFQELFQVFFEDIFERVALLFRPPYQMHGLKDEAYQAALGNSTYCLTFIAQAHLEVSKENGAQLSARDDFTTTMYNNLLRMCRQRVEDFDDSNIDCLIMAMVTLCQYDLALDRLEDIRHHYTGLRVLVARRGGEHSLGNLCLPYVLGMDKRLALCFNERPCFEDAHLSEIMIARPFGRLRRTGATFFNAMGPAFQILSDTVISFCDDAAYLIDLMEDLDITYDPSSIDEPQDSAAEYFYYLRENVDIRYAIIAPQFSHGEIMGSTPENQLVFAAARMITYIVTQINYMPAISDILASSMYELLRMSLALDSMSSGPAITLMAWRGNVEMLLWVLYACALPYVNVQYESDSIQMRRYDSVVRVILPVAESLHGERPVLSPKDWDDLVLDTLRCFVWSDRSIQEFEAISDKMQDIVLSRV